MDALLRRTYTSGYSQYYENKKLEDQVIHTNEYQFQDQCITEIKNAIITNLQFDHIKQLLDPRYQDLALIIINSQYGQLILDFLKNHLIHQFEILQQQQQPTKDLYDLVFTLNKVLSLSYNGNHYCYSQMWEALINIICLLYDKTFQLFHTTIVEILSKILDNYNGNIQNEEQFNEFILKMLQLDDLSLCELKLLLSMCLKLYTSKKSPSGQLLSQVISNVIQAISSNHHINALQELVNLLLLVSQINSDVPQRVLAAAVNFCVQVYQSKAQSFQLKQQSQKLDMSLQELVHQVPTYCGAS